MMTHKEKFEWVMSLPKEEYRKYITECHSVKEIAAIYGRTPAYVIQQLKRKKIPISNLARYTSPNGKYEREYHPSDYAIFFEPKKGSLGIASFLKNKVALKEILKSDPSILLEIKKIIQEVESD